MASAADAHLRDRNAASGRQRQVVFTVTYGASTVGQQLNFPATVSGTEPETNPNNNSANVVSTVSAAVIRRRPSRC